MIYPFMLADITVSEYTLFNMCLQIITFDINCKAM